MTVTEERPRRRGRRAAPPQGGRPADHRPYPLDRQHRAAGHAAHRDGAQPVRPRDDHLDRHPPRRRQRPASSPSSPAPTSPTSRAPACRAPGRSPRTRSRRPTRRWPSTTVNFAGEIVAVRRGPHRGRGPRRRRARRRRLRRPAGGARPGRRRRRTRSLVHPDLGTNVSPPGSSTPPRPAPAATSRRRSPGQPTS